MGESDSEVRGLPAPLWGVVSLPPSIAGGFVSVAFIYELGRHGVGMAAISGLAGLALLPSTWQFLAGPAIDMSLTQRRWYGLAGIVLLTCLIGIGFTPATAAALPVLGALCFVGACSHVCLGVSAMSAMAATTAPEARGPIGGWVQAANLGGAGLGGGLGLWIVTHAGGAPTACVILSAICVLCALPMIRLRVPPPARAATLAAQSRYLGVQLWALARTRNGVLAIMAETLPAALGAAMGLLPAVAGQWHASADLVALVRGALGGAASIPGCLVGGYLCRRFRHRTVYMWAALAYAAAEAAMAFAPHTPAFFAFFVILNALILGVAFGPLSAIVYDCLGPAAAATVGSALFSLCNLPLVVMVLVVGHAEAKLGADGMLLTEAGVAVVAIGFYGLVAWLWKPGASGVVMAVAE
jgi:MFS family permease